MFASFIKGLTTLDSSFVPVELWPYDGFWHDRSAFQWSAFWRSTAGNDVEATIVIILFPFFFSSITFPHRRNAQIKKLILRKLLRKPKNLGVDTFPDPVGHFEAPGGRFGF